jgi:hypothetical protein
LGAVHIPVLLTPRAARDRRDVDARNKLGNVVGAHEPRGNSFVVLETNALGKPCQLGLGIGEEEVAASIETERNGRREPFRCVGVEGDRLAR